MWPKANTLQRSFWVGFSRSTVGSPDVNEARDSETENGLMKKFGLTRLGQLDGDTSMIGNTRQFEAQDVSRQREYES